MSHALTFCPVTLTSCYLDGWLTTFFTFLCGLMSAYCTVGHLWVSLSLFVWTSSRTHVLLDPLESQWRVMKELTWTLLSSGWVCRESNSPVLLTTSITQKQLLIDVNKTKPLFIIQWLKSCMHNKGFLFQGWNLPNWGILLLKVTS